MKRPLEISRLFVGGLSYATMWQGLKDHFNQAGDVEFASVLLKPDGTSKGCGMVNFHTPEGAARAAMLLNGSTLDGRHISAKLDVMGHNHKRPLKSCGDPSPAVAVSSAFASLGNVGNLPVVGSIGSLGHCSGLNSLGYGTPGSAGIAGFANLLAQTGLLGGLASPAQRQALPRNDGVQLPPEQISRVFVGNIAFTTTWQQLKDHFKMVGDVEFTSILTNPDGSSKGCGMVNFLTHECAVAAVTALNGSALDGRPITVKLDVDGFYRERPPPKLGVLHQQPRQQRQQQPPQRPPQQQLSSLADDVAPVEGRSLPAEEITRVFVGSLSFSTTWRSLKDHFGQAGEVEFASVLLHPDGKSKGCGMVNYDTHEDALRAASLLHGTALDGRGISVKLDVDGRFKDRPPKAPRAFSAPLSGPAEPGGELQARSAGSWPEPAEPAESAEADEPGHGAGLAGNW